MRYGLRSQRRTTLLVFAPLACLLVAVVAMRLGASGQSKPRHSESPGGVSSGAEPEQPLVWAAVTRDHRALNVADARTAYETAKVYVRGRLPAEERAGARFSPWPPRTAMAGDPSAHTEVDRIAPHLWRVRGSVEWPSGKPGAASIRERFETDLQHGPADDRWRLIDTEWLDPSWMPDPDKGRHERQDGSTDK